VLRASRRATPDRMAAIHSDLQIGRAGHSD